MSEIETVFTLEEICQKDHIEFWTQQLSEHALFIYLGIVGIDDETKSLRKIAKEFYESLQDIHISYKEGNENEREQIRADLKLEIDDLAQFKKEVLERIKSEWSGWLFPEFISHILNELNYFKQREYGQDMRDEDIVRFWNNINSEHADFTAHLLGTSEKKLIRKAMEFEEKFYGLNNDEKHDHDGLDILQFTLLSQHMSEEMDKFTSAAQKGISTGKILSVIHPLLINHVRREGQRSICELTEILEKHEY